jgi:vacuolar-type H+-ATPase subunit E/Vma4
MALDDIIQSILAEAKQEAAKIKQQGIAEIEALKKEYRSKTESEEKRILASAEKEANKKTEQAKFLALSQKKAALLTKKQERLDQVYQLAEKRLSQLPQTDYEKLLVSLIKKLNENHGEIVPVEGKEVLTKEALKKSGKPYQLSATSVPGQGGFVFQTAKMTIDNRFSVLIDHVREDTEMAVSKILFGEK